MEGKFRFSALLLVAVIVAVFILQSLFPALTDDFLLDSPLLAERPWTLLTAIFLHGSLFHMMSNIFALALFGLLLEKAIGTNKFLILFFASGIFANIIASFFYAQSLGASGAIFGLIGALAALRPRLVVWTYGVPMPMAVAAAFWFILDFAGAFYPSDVANVAHMAGLLSGIAAGIMLRKSHTEEKPSRKEKLLKEEELDDWEKEWM